MIAKIFGKAKGKAYFCPTFASNLVCMHQDPDKMFIALDRLAPSVWYGTASTPSATTAYGVRTCSTMRGAGMITSMTWLGAGLSKRVRATIQGLPRELGQSLVACSAYIINPLV